jgi:hypothetical protein
MPHDHTTKKQHHNARKSTTLPKRTMTFPELDAKFARESKIIQKEASFRLGPICPFIPAQIFVCHRNGKTFFSSQKEHKNCECGACFVFFVCPEWMGGGGSENPGIRVTELMERPLLGSSPVFSA